MTVRLPSCSRRRSGSDLALLDGPAVLIHCSCSVLLRAALEWRGNVCSVKLLKKNYRVVFSNGLRRVLTLADIVTDRATRWLLASYWETSPRWRRLTQAVPGLLFLDVIRGGSETASVLVLTLLHSMGDEAADGIIRDVDPKTLRMWQSALRSGAPAGVGGGGGGGGGDAEVDSTNDGDQGDDVSVVLCIVCRKPPVTPFMFECCKLFWCATHLSEWIRTCVYAEQLVGPNDQEESDRFPVCPMGCHRDRKDYLEIHTAKAWLLPLPGRSIPRAPPIVPSFSSSLSASSSSVSSPSSHKPAGGEDLDSTLSTAPSPPVLSPRSQKRALRWKNFCTAGSTSSTPSSSSSSSSLSSSSSSVNSASSSFPSALTVWELENKCRPAASVALPLVVSAPVPTRSLARPSVLGPSRRKQSLRGEERPEQVLLLLLLFVPAACVVGLSFSC
jgi:hypothetical protein